MSKIGLVFPGQGSQFVGMGKELIAVSETAKSIFARADAALGMSLSTMILEGPEEALKETENAQPAILTASVAAWEAFREKYNLNFSNCICAGHSLGEYTALVAARVMDFETAVQLVRKRGRYMQEAAAACDGGMAAVLGKTENEVRSLCGQGDGQPGVQVANLNSPGQVVVSGSKKTLEVFSQSAAEQKIKVIPLAVSGPFHSALMQSAADKLTVTLKIISFKPAVMPVIANVSALPITEPEAIRESLIKQVTGSVRWEESMRKMISSGVGRMIEIGPGKVLRGLMKKIDRGIPVLGVFDPEEIKATIERISNI
ncbi:ACP S-malonyltransferase [bacterium]|nr:ACP S-malonyltransferase [bacterium]